MASRARSQVANLLPIAESLLRVIDLYQSRDKFTQDDMAAMELDRDAYMRAYKDMFLSWLESTGQRCISAHACCPFETPYLQLANCRHVVCWKTIMVQLGTMSEGPLAIVCPRCGLDPQNVCTNPSLIPLHSHQRLIFAQHPLRMMPELRQRLDQLKASTIDNHVATFISQVEELFESVPNNDDE